MADSKPAPPEYDKLSAPPPPLPLAPEDQNNKPPAYEQSQEGAGPDPDEVLDPAVLVIHGRFIYLQTPSGDADSEPLYQLSRAIHAQGHATEKIGFQRMDLRVRTKPDGTPAVSKRAKDVYELEHRNPLRYSGLPFQAWLAPQSRKTLGKVAIEKSPPLSPRVSRRAGRLGRRDARADTTRGGARKEGGLSLCA